MIVGELLRHKGSRVVTVRPDQTLEEAIQLLVEHGVGALLVAGDGGAIQGILTERDILRQSARAFDRLAGTPVSAIMSKDVLIGLVDDSLDYVMGLMTEKRIRHLPILEGSKLAGIISIGDVVKTKCRQSEVEIRHLTEYITGKYPG